MGRFTDIKRRADNITKKFSTVDDNKRTITGKADDELKKDLDLEDLEAAYRDNPVGFRAINKRSTDPWDKGFQILNSDGERWEEAEQKLKDLNFKHKAREVTKYGLVHGSSALAIGWKERQGSQKEAEDPTNWDGVTGIGYLNIISRDEMSSGDDAFEINEYGVGEEDYGELQKIELEDETKVHRDRFVYFRPYSISNSPDGISLLEPMYTSLTVFDNVVYGAGQSYYYSGTGFPTLETKGLSDEEQEEVRNDFLDNIQNQPGMVFDQDDFDFSFEGAEGKALDPRKYLEPMFTILGGALGGSKQVFFGAESGEVSGSETNLEEYFGDVSSFQEFKLTPFVREFIDRLITAGILEEQQYEISWNDMFEKSEEKKAQIAKDKARAFAQFKKSGLTNEEAAELAGIDKEIIKEPDGQGMADDSGMEAGEPSPEERNSEEQEPEA